MKTTRRIEIVTVTEKIVVLRNRQHQTYFWCEKCLRESRLLTPEEAAVILRVGLRHIYRWVESEEVHFIEPEGGKLYLCLHSVTAKS